MPWPRPTLAEVDARLAADVESRLPGLDPQLRRSFVGALVRSVAGAHHELYGYLDWISRQVFPDTADADELARWAVIWGLVRGAAAAATGSLTVTGADGSIIPAAARWRRGDGAEYEATAEATVAAGTAAVSVRAVVAGAAGNAGSGTRLTLVSPVAGVVSEAVVADAGVGGGSDAESDDALRARLLARLRAPPDVGTAADYVHWARSAHPSVTRAWARANTPALGQVTVYAMTDGATSNGIPGAGTLSVVRGYIAARRPLTADVTVSAPTPTPLAVTIRSLTPDTPAIRAAIEDEIADLILRDSEPGGTIRISRLREAISGAEGETDHTLAAPVADVTHTAARIAVAGVVTWRT